MTAEAAPSNSLKDWLTLALCAALLLLFAGLSYSAVLTKNATYDEPLHAVSGYAIRTFGDYRIDPEDPALFTRLSALPHGSNALKFDKDDANFKSIFKVHDAQWFSAVKTLYDTPGNDADAYINRSRFVFMLIGLATGALVCWWAWKLAGRIGAFAATACYGLDPNFLGHASLVKNDVPLALVTVGLMFAIWRAGRRATWWNLAGVAVALAAAMNLKFSGPIFVMITFVALVARALMPGSWKVISWELKTRFTRLIMPFATCLVAGIVAYIAIWACYGFRFAPTSDPSLHFDFNAIVDRGRTNVWQIQNQNRDKTKLTNDQLMSEVKQIPTPRLATITQSLLDHKLLPEAWLDGFYYTYATTLLRGTYLNGRYSITGWWYFFPLSVIYKTPTAVLVTALFALLVPIGISIRRGFEPWDALVGVAAILLLWRIVSWAIGQPWSANWTANLNGVIIGLIVVRLIPILLKRTQQTEWWAAVCLITPVIIYGGTAMMSNFNLGIRHVLPLLPFLHLACGIIVSRMLWRWGTIGALLAAGLGMALAIESCSAWPGYISFFNAPAGGWRGGVFKLSDSNLDWGQDLKLLADWQKAHPDKNLYLCYFGTADPDYYRIKRVELWGGYDLSQQIIPGAEMPPGIIAMSATRLQGTYMTPQQRDLYSPLHKCEPREILGGTIYLYDWPLRPPTTQQ
jgi:hypothetical protein